MIQAAEFYNGQFCTGRYAGGKGESWWMISTFQDGSVLCSTLGLRRASETAKLALDYWQIKADAAAPGTSTMDAFQGILNRLTTLAMTQPIRDAGKARRERGGKL